MIINTNANQNEGCFNLKLETVAKIRNPDKVAAVNNFTAKTKQFHGVLGSNTYFSSLFEVRQWLLQNSPIEYYNLMAYEFDGLFLDDMRLFHCEITKNHFSSVNVWVIQHLSANVFTIIHVHSTVEFQDILVLNSYSWSSLESDNSKNGFYYCEGEDEEINGVFYQDNALNEDDPKSRIDQILKSLQSCNEYHETFKQVI